MSPERSLRLASFDGGGPRAFSQLVIMKRFMYQVGGRGNQGKSLLPCDWFDMIGGSDTGGLIAIMFVKLRMSVEEVMQEFSRIMGQVYAKGLEPAERTRRMKNCVEALLVKKGFPAGLLLEEQQHGRQCVGFVVSALNLNVMDKVCFRTYFVLNDPPSNVTVVDAILATCASPPEFLPVEIGVEPENTEYVGASIGTNNPIRHLITEAHVHFERESRVGLILSTGSGHPGVFAFDPKKKNNGLRTILLEMMRDAESEASKIQTMVYSRIYFRFSVAQGLQNAEAHAECFKWISAQTNAYIRLGNAAKKLRKCVVQAQNDKVQISLKRLNRAWGLYPDTPSDGTGHRTVSGDGVPFGGGPVRGVSQHSPEVVDVESSEKTPSSLGLGENVPSPDSTIYYSVLEHDAPVLDITCCSPMSGCGVQYVESPTGAAKNLLGSVYIEVGQEVESQQVLDSQMKHPNRSYSETIDDAYTRSFAHNVQSRPSNAELVPEVLRDRGVHFESPESEDTSSVAASTQFSAQSRQRRGPSRRRTFSIQAMGQQKKGALNLRRFSTSAPRHKRKRISSFDSSHSHASGTREPVEEDSTAAKAKALEDARMVEQLPLADEVESKRSEDGPIDANTFMIKEAQDGEERITAAARAAERQSAQAGVKQTKERERRVQQILLRALRYVPMARLHGRLQTATVTELLRSALPAALLSQISTDLPHVRENHSTVATALGLGILTAQGTIFTAA